MRLWERICKDLQDFGGGFVGIHEDSRDFERGFVGIHETLGENS